MNHTLCWILCALGLPEVLASQIANNAEVDPLDAIESQIAAVRGDAELAARIRDQMSDAGDDDLVARADAALRSQNDALQGQLDALSGERDTLQARLDSAAAQLTEDARTADRLAFHARRVELLGLAGGLRLDAADLAALDNPAIEQKLLKAGAEAGLLVLPDDETERARRLDSADYRAGVLQSLTARPLPYDPARLAGLQLPGTRPTAPPNTPPAGAPAPTAPPTPHRDADAPPALGDTWLQSLRPAPPA